MATSNPIANGTRHESYDIKMSPDHPKSLEGPSQDRRALEVQDAGYYMPESGSRLDEVDMSAPIQIKGENRLRQSQSLGHTSSREQRAHRRGSRASHPDSEYDIPDDYAHLNDLATSLPVENAREVPVYLHKSLEETKDEEQEYEQDRRDQERKKRDSIARGEKPPEEEKKDVSIKKVSKFATQLYTISYLILFSIFGTLGRLGLQSITFYPGAPVIFSELWANVGGSLFMGFLGEDRMLFKEEWGTATYHHKLQEWKAKVKDEENSSGLLAMEQGHDLQAAKKAHAATKKTIPLYIGLATGFCGSFTSFSSFVRDTFLALSNSLPSPLNHPQDYSPVVASTNSTVSRNGGYSFMATLAVVITTVSLCLAALFFGAHLAIFLEPYIPSLSFRKSRKYLDPFAVFLAWGCWLGAVFLAIFPPDRNDAAPEIWRGRAVFALVFAPIGCLGRFYVSLYLNGKLPSFPLGTFAVNMLGTAIMGMAYDLQHVPLGGVIGCQVLQGIEDGFCGCLTTVSTWVVELSSLRRSHAYRYGMVSVLGGLALMVVIMGSFRWTHGFEGLLCTH
ncbi:2e41eb6e-ccf8-4f54-8231-8418f9711dff-CDS [Sclerotinia trifoliorum]|uniref:2e41eb6e-ccf8-4f54-8231-8418f9711dff-CDS n=1 Tax=Sclerotinia trifoliorum TaxID=28548 RepID=A0A8H2ZM89_9HELO|nr:2e41eb6e-ccf8-4f54-8231-8418f9711dff-CDS [Sclerotinia trifoliorum]